MGKLRIFGKFACGAVLAVAVLTAAAPDAVSQASRELPGCRSVGAQRRSAPPAVSAQTAAKVADALAQRIDYYWHRGDYDSIAFLCSQIVQLDPYDVETWANYAWILWAGLDREDEAMRVLKRGLSLNPHRYELYYEVAFLLYQQRRYSEAAQYLEKGLKYPAPPLAWNLYAHALEKGGNPKAAADLWRRMQKKFPDFELSQVNLDRLKRKGLIE